MTFTIDLHVHSFHSGDNDADPEETVQRAIELGLSGIAFTEHYFYAASEHALALREKYQSAIRIFRGVEFSTAEGHCLVFGMDPDRLDLKYAPAGELVRAVNGAGGVVIPSHPFRPGTSLMDRVLQVPGITGLEGCNGANMHAYNVQAIEAAASLGLPYTGGSDAHAPGEVGSCFTVFSVPVTYEDFVEQLKAGNYQGVDTRKISRSLIGKASDV